MDVEEEKEEKKSEEPSRDKMMNIARLSKGQKVRLRPLIMTSTRMR